MPAAALQVARPARSAGPAPSRRAGRATPCASRSAYRSYSEQTAFTSIKRSSRATAPRAHSEHQLGTIDLRLPTSAAIAWLAEHAPEHGFTLSYPRQAAHHRLSPRAPACIRHVGLNWRGSYRAGA